MRKLALAVVVVGAGLALAAPDVVPWYTVNDQREATVPQRFDQRVEMGADLILARLDAGSAYIGNNLQVNGVIISSGVQPLANEATVDAGQIYVQNQLNVRGSIVQPLAFTFDYDFPACTAGDTQFSKDKTLTLTGLAMGDPCVVGVVQASPSDGGSAYVRDSIFTAVAMAANTLELRQFCTGADAGIRNAPDAGFHGFCFQGAP